MPLGRPCAGRASYVRMKLQLASNAYVYHGKNSLRLKSDDELASYLLATIEADCSIRVAESCAIPETTMYQVKDLRFLAVISFTDSVPCSPTLTSTPINTVNRVVLPQRLLHDTDTYD